MSVSMYRFLIVMLSLKLIFPWGRGEYSSISVFIREANQILGKLIHVLSVEESRESLSLALVRSLRQRWPPGSGQALSWVVLQMVPGWW